MDSASAADEIRRRLADFHSPVHAIMMKDAWDGEEELETLRNFAGLARKIHPRVRGRLVSEIYELMLRIPGLTAWEQAMIHAILAQEESKVADTARLALRWHAMEAQRLIGSCEATDKSQWLSQKVAALLEQFPALP